MQSFCTGMHIRKALNAVVCLTLGRSFKSCCSCVSTETLRVAWPSTKDLNTHAKLFDFCSFKILFHIYSPPILQIVPLVSVIAAIRTAYFANRI